jgi:peptidase MA superfamily protein
VIAGEKKSAVPPAGSACQPLAVTLVRSASSCGDCFVACTRNFRVSWCASEQSVRELALHCEQLAATSRAAWLGKDGLGDWTPKCDVVVHPSTTEYVQALGPGSEQTTGCATIRLDGGRVVLRRVDLRADGVDWNTEALPHELTHVVLADRFCKTQIPPWADEGIALLSESPERMKQRLGELRRVAGGGFLYGARDLITIKTPPQPEFRPLFYGQSLALVSLLLDCGSREQLLQFVEISQIKGFDGALRDVYGDRRLAKFERRFDTYVTSDRPLAWARQDVVAATTRPRTAASSE